MLKKHRPPHSCFSDGKIYFTTCSTYQKEPLFDCDSKKIMLRNVIGGKVSEFGVKIFAFVIMPSHYHILIKTKDDLQLPDFIKGINGKSACLLNEIDKSAKRKVWHNYWDSCIRKEEDF